MEAWRGHFPLCLFKRVATGVEVHFYHRCRSRQIVRVLRILPELPQTCPKSLLCKFCPQIFSHKDMKTSFWCNFSKTVFMCFYANFGRHFYPDFQGFCPDFQQIKTFGVALATHTPPAPTPLLSQQYHRQFHRLPISTRNKFIAAILAPRKFRMIFYNFCHYFWGQHCWWTETKFVTIFLL